jgi:hypothetical protein
VHECDSVEGLLDNAGGRVNSEADSILLDVVKVIDAKMRSGASSVQIAEALDEAGLLPSSTESEWFEDDLGTFRQVRLVTNWERVSE